MCAKVDEKFADSLMKWAKFDDKSVCWGGGANFVKNLKNFRTFGAPLHLCSFLATPLTIRSRSKPTYSALYEINY